MNANCRWFWNNLADAATLTATDAAANFPVTNIQTTFRQELWKSLNVTGAKKVTFNCGAVINLTACIIQDHNFTAAATVELHGSTDNFASSDVTLGTFTLTRVDNGNCIVVNPLVLFISLVSTYQYFQIKITDAANPAVFVSIGRVFLGTYTETTPMNFMAGNSITPTSLSQVERSANGVVHVLKLPNYKIFDLSYHVVQVTQKDAFRQIIDYVQIDLPLWCYLYPSDPGADLYCIYCRFTKMPAQINVRYILWDFACQIAEDL